ATLAQSLLERSRLVGRGRPDVQAAAGRDSGRASHAFDQHLDDPEHWRQQQRLTEFLHRFGLDPDKDIDNGSGGERKRAALALAFSIQADVLLLDEPTNHLDIEGIEK